MQRFLFFFRSLLYKPESMKDLSTIVALLMLFVAGLHAQVVINEYSASNLRLIKDGFNKTEDWVELYNTSDQAIDLSGWFLSDKEDDNQKWAFSSGTSIAPNSFLTVFCSGRDGLFGTEHHASFKLTQTEGNDVLVISDSAGTIVDLVTLNLTLVEHSNCRSTDGSGEWMVCTAPSFGLSNNGSVQALRYTETPQMDFEAGFYKGPMIVSISTEEQDVDIRFTLDGSNPLADSPIYTEPLTIDKTTVVKAQAYSRNPQILAGKIEFNTYFIDEEYSLPVFSVAADRVTNLANGIGEILPRGSIEYFKSNERVTTSFGELNRHGQDSWALDHRSIDWISRDEMGYSKAVAAPIFSTSDRDEFQRFMFRNSGDDNYPAINDGFHDGSTHVRDEYVQTLAEEGNMRLDVRKVERVVLFLNGQYWGLYGMREKVVDHDYTSEYYDQGKNDLHFLSTWGATEIEYGGPPALEEWIDFRDFILDNDMSDSNNFQRVADEMDLVSFIDYFSMNQAVVAIDWLNYNTGWWKGLNPEGSHKKWGYLLWDLDATFDYYINYTGVPDESANATFCDIYDISDSMDEFFDFEGGLSPCDFFGGNNTPYESNDPILDSIVSLFPECCNDWTSECQAYYDDPSTIPDPIDLFSDCPSILNGSSPYTADDSIFVQVVVFFEDCCEEWDLECQSWYSFLSPAIVDVSQCPIILNGTSPYEADDPILAEVVEFNVTCCDEWSTFCQETYDFLAVDIEDFSNCPAFINQTVAYRPNDPKVGFVMSMNPDCCEEWGLSCERDYSLLEGDQFAEPDDPELTGFGGNVGQHEKILIKLLEESPDFKQLYYSRFADLMNTVYTCDNMNDLLDRMIAVIEPEMPRQIARWGGSMTEWRSNVDELRNFINRRCLVLNDEAMSCFNEVEGQYTVTIVSEPKDVGLVEFNTLNINDLPWSGDYFGNMDNLAEAKVKPEFENTYVFSHWESKMGNNITPSDLDQKMTYRLSMPDTLIAHYKVFDDGSLRGSIVINELMASNESSSTDEAGEAEDWIELYNKGNSSIDLSGFYLTDNPQNLMKYQIPANTILNPDNYLIIWADEDEEQGAFHTNFKLSKSGETVLLLDSEETILDQVTYPALETDLTYARKPNGSGGFRVSEPTFNENNGQGTSTTNPQLVEDRLIAYPNPANNQVTIQFKKNGHALEKVVLRDLLGKEVRTYKDLNEAQLIIDISELNAGFYLITANDNYSIKIIKK